MKQGKKYSLTPPSLYFIFFANQNFDYLIYSKWVYFSPNSFYDKIDRKFSIFIDIGVLEGCAMWIVVLNCRIYNPRFRWINKKLGFLQEYSFFFFFFIKNCVFTVDNHSNTERH